MSQAEDRLLEALDYTFSRRELLSEALTHRSFVNEVSGPEQASLPDNERLELLGDAVLDLVVTAELMERFPEAREGELSRMRAAMVHEGAFAALARRIGLGPAMRLGRGEELSGGRDRSSLLADAFEATVAAVYLDGGFETAHRVVKPLLDFEQVNGSDPKTELQHRFQGRLKVTPRYRLAGETGPEHDKQFVVEVFLEDGTVLGKGEGRSKKLAERDAAERALAADDAEKPGR